MPRIVQLEREAEQTRADLAHTLDTLRDRMSPGQMLDQVIDYAREGEAAEMFANLRRQVIENPLPLGLAGIGIGWLMVSGKSHPSERADGEWDRAKSSAAEFSERGKAKAEEMKAGFESAKDRMAGRASEAVNTFRQTRDEIGAKANEMGEAVAQRTRDSVSSVNEGFRSARETFLSACREQPLILAGLGLALGAAFGAALPRTEQEDRLMGEKSDQLKDKIQETASEQFEAVKSSAEQQMDHARDIAEEKAGEMQDALAQAGAQMTGGNTANPDRQNAQASDSGAPPDVITRPDLTSDGEAEREQR